ISSHADAPRQEAPRRFEATDSSRRSHDRRPTLVPGLRVRACTHRSTPEAPVKLALAGDTMLGRGVAEALQARSPGELFAPEVLEATHEADLFVLNLECCISDRGLPWPDPGKPFFFRAPPCAVEALVQLGVDCVTLANNHALDFGACALLDTFEHLDAAGIT